jgi:hypothetical protein
MSLVADLAAAATDIPSNRRVKARTYRSSGSAAIPLPSICDKGHYHIFRTQKKIARKQAVST